MDWPAKLFACEKWLPALKAIDELVALMAAQLLFPNQRVSRAGSSSTVSVSRSVKVSSLRMVVTPSRAAQVCGRRPLDTAHRDGSVTGRASLMETGTCRLGTAR